MDVNPDTLKGLRLRRGWTQSHLADAAGLSLRTVQRIEKDGRGASETVLGLCAALDVSPDQLARDKRAASETAISFRLLILAVALALVLGIAIGVGASVSLA